MTTDSRTSSTGSSGETPRPQTTSVGTAAKRKRSATAAPRKPRRWKLAHERTDGQKEMNAAYIKYLFDKVPNVTLAERRTLFRAAQHYGLPIDYPPAEFNEENRRQEAYPDRV